MTTPGEVSEDRPPLSHPDNLASVERKPLPGLRRVLAARPSGIQLFVSVLIAALGILASKALAVVDQDLRSMYTEYTLAATNLAHTSTDLLRYRVTIQRAIEAPSRKEFERIADSLPDQRSRLMKAVEGYAEAAKGVLRSGSRGDQDLQAFRRSLQSYFTSADQTIAYLVQLWDATTQNEGVALRQRAEWHAAENAGPKLVDASDALERLLFGVAELGKEMRDQGSDAIRVTSLALLLGSLLIAALNILKV